ncbi:putative ribonuclease H-like domain-containing protein [Tanacetum coccineum]
MEFESAQSNTTAKLPILKLAQKNGTSVIKMSVPVTTEEKTNKKNDVKARSLLLMALPNEHQLTFSQYGYAKTMFAAIETRFRGVAITQEDLNSKFLRSLPPEWNTHVVVWMNKADIETISIDDLYNNFKIVEQDVKKFVGASSGAQNFAFMTAPSTSSTNDVNTANPTYKVNPNGSNLLQKDLKQIHEDDLEAMDLKWQLSLLSMRAKRYFQRTGKKIFINANDTAGYDKSSIVFQLSQDGTLCQGNVEHQEQRESVFLAAMAEEQVQTNMALMAFSDSEIDLSYSGLDEFKDPEFKSYGSEDSEQESNIVCDKKLDASKENLRLLKEEQYRSTEKAVNTARPKSVNTARPKAVNTARPHSAVVNAVRVNQANVVKASTCFGIRDHKLNSASITLKKPQTLKHEADPPRSEFDGGYVTFGGGAHGGRISSKRTLKTDSLDFEDVYFLPDESQIHLKVLEMNDTTVFGYEETLFLKRNLTCLVAKATSRLNTMLWPRDLGHINFKNINKVLRIILVRVAAGIISNESVCTQGELNADGPYNECDEKDKSEDDSSPKEVNVAGQHVNTVSPEVNTGRFELNTVDPSVNTAIPTTPNTRIHKDHPIKNVIGDVKSSIQTRRMTKSTSEQGFLSAVYEEKTRDTLNTCLYACFLSQIEPTSIAKALSDSSWVEAMQEELLQFKLQQVWKLMDLPIGKRAIGTKWVFKNKKDERGIMIRNKARIEAIRLLLAYASFMGFLVYQMDVKSAFLYRTIKEEVYVTQPPEFKDLDHPDKVYKVVKALYRLHQAPRAWYETLANYLLGNGFKRGKIDHTLFIKKQKGDIFLVQVYVDDIIFGSTNKELCIGFEKLMKDKF